MTLCSSFARCIIITNKASDYQNKYLLSKKTTNIPEYQNSNIFTSGATFLNLLKSRSSVKQKSIVVIR